MRYRTGIGQDSHRFEEQGSKKCIIAGLEFDDVPGFSANSDGDVVFHALCNAITTVTGVPILGALADTLCLEKKITDSEEYLKEALKTLGNQKISHVSISLEGKRPKFKERVREMRDNIARVIGINPSQIGIMATTGEGLTGFGRGEGVQCFCIITTEEPA
ncbi:2-C-methyl-D-erythritol 2,4-cyclodiphosphate synthase [Estrella lausannensis]|uniref:2-C-methyl-D-erythritol 2,4-cyclodiphosphate synthase n=1 Tax=Estrella lausannensis TaxID=483423 RepID=A0A0H5DQQ5_9BACT|nr:2-C-methyl-D-erythritol 2,4-cyclodiphosphate synthase [Estrella lausannensis]CRX38991.1 2-C-methyl-D-erythritol 2,4-cyclodiphosphate synthase [Estrella lausannensis]